MSRPCEQWAAACVDAAEGHPPEDFVEHAQQCRACSETVDELREGMALIDPGPAPVPGPWLAGSIRRAAEKKRRGLPRRLIVLAPMAAAAGLLVFLSVIGGRASESHETLVRKTAELDDPSVATLEEGPWSETSLGDLDWEDEWGVGIEGLLARADPSDLERLVESLEPLQDAQPWTSEGQGEPR